MDGHPTSSNRASSMHLFWDVPALDTPIVEVRATLEVFEAPRVAELWFWALQVSFGAEGGAHLGLQWHPSYPRSRAANFGGYATDGGELSGGPLAHRSALANPNTCDFAWEPGRPYVLSIGRVGPGVWIGAVDDERLRELHCDDGGAGLSNPTAWTECFAGCDAAPATVRWSDFELRGASGDVTHVEAARVSYQSERAGGCATGRIDEVAPGVWLQTTGVSRSPAP